MTNEERELREKALAMSINHTDSDAMILRRAEAFLKFLRGEAATSGASA